MSLNNKEELADNLLLKYILKECNEDEYALIDEWLSASAENQSRLFELEMALDYPHLQQLTEEEHIAYVEKKLSQRYNASPGRKLRSRRITLWGAAAAILIASVLFVFKGDLMDSQIAVTVNPNEAVKLVTLPDGTKVWLNSSSTLKYSDKFSHSNRKVHLDGEAYFEVVRNSESPFVVSSKSIDVKVLGTTFNMKAYGSMTLAEATLIDGEIEIKGNNSEGQVILSPGQKAVVDVTAKRMTVKEIKNAKLDAIWRDNLIPFKETNIYDIAETLEQLYDVRIVFTEGTRITNSYSGVIRKKDSIEEVLKSLKNSIPITYSISGDTIYIAKSKHPVIKEN